MADSIRIIQLEVTPEIDSTDVAETFPLGDGRSVEWAAATRADHLERIELLSLQLALRRLMHPS